MKHIYLALSLAFLLFASCGTNNQPVEEDTTELSQDYVTISDDQPAITGEIKDGGLWLTFHKDQILPVGIVDDDSYRLPDEPVKVEGLKGAPKNFIIADMGQDYNPILCVLTEEGKVQMLSLWNTVSTGDLEATVIPMDNIVGFTDGPGGPWEDEDGTVFYDYVTIYGLDEEGNEYEVDEYTLYNWLKHYVYGDDPEWPTTLYTLNLSADWKMRFVEERLQEEAVVEKQGRFWPIALDWDGMRFRYGYELTRLIDATDLSSDPKESEICEKGVFELSYSDNPAYFVVNPIEGLDLTGQGLNQPVEFQASVGY